SLVGASLRVSVTLDADAHLVHLEVPGVPGDVVWVDDAPHLVRRHNIVRTGSPTLAAQVLRHPLRVAIIRRVPVMLRVAPPVDRDRRDLARSPTRLVRGCQLRVVVVGHFASFVTLQSSHGSIVLCMDQLKVAVAMGDASGVAAYRLRWPSEAVAEKTGWDVRAYRPEEISVAEQPGTYLGKGRGPEGLDLGVTSRHPSPKDLRTVA